MKGFYIRFRCDAVPDLNQVAQYVGGTFTACHHPDIRGGMCIEVVSMLAPQIHPSSWADYECHEVHAPEFFADSLLEAGGLSFAGHRQLVHASRMPPKWRAAMGFLTHVLDDVDISHPRAVHAATEFNNFLAV
jgi:hypothetical protein